MTDSHKVKNKQSKTLCVSEKQIHTDYQLCNILGKY